MQPGEWRRPAGLTALATAVVPAPFDHQEWSDLVARSAAAETLSRVRRELADEGTPQAADDDWPTDFAGVWTRLAGDAEAASATAAAALFAKFQQLSEEQVQGLTESVRGTALELRLRELAEAGEGEAPEDEPEPDPDPEQPPTDADEVPETPEQQLVRAAQLRVHTAARAALARTGVDTRLLHVPGADLVGTDVVTAQARSIAGSLVPIHALNEFVPEVAVVSLAASAGMRLRNGESVEEVKAWLVGELSTMGVANAAMMAVQLLSGLVVLRPLAVLGAKWGRARAETSAQATVAIRTARERLAPLLEG